MGIKPTIGVGPTLSEFNTTSMILTTPTEKYRIVIEIYTLAIHDGNREGGLRELGRVGSSEAIRWMDPQCSGNLGLVSRIARPFHHE